MVLVLGRRDDLARAGDAWTDHVTVVHADLTSESRTINVTSLGAALIRPDGWSPGPLIRLATPTVSATCSEH